MDNPIYVKKQTDTFLTDNEIYKEIPLRRYSRGGIFYGCFRTALTFLLYRRCLYCLMEIQQYRLYAGGFMSLSVRIHDYRVYIIGIVAVLSEYAYTHAPVGVVF